MHAAAIVLFAFSSNIDNFLLGMSYGIKKIRIPFLSNLIIGLITFAGTLVSMLAGKSLLHVLPATAAKLIGSLIVTGIGVYYLLKFLWGKLHKKAAQGQDGEPYGKYDKDGSGRIEWGESFALGFALSVNNMGLGVSASLAGLSVIAAALSSLLCSLVFIAVSNAFGKSCIARFLGGFAEPLASVLIILLGIYEMVA